MKDVKISFINQMAQCILWLDRSLRMRQQGEKKKKAADICQKAVCAKWEMRVCLEKEEEGTKVG